MKQKDLVLQATIEALKKRIIDYIRDHGPDTRICYHNSFIENQSEEYKNENLKLTSALGTDNQGHLKRAIFELEEDRKIWKRRMKGQGKYLYYNLIENPQALLKVLDGAKGAIETFLLDNIDQLNGNGKITLLQTEIRALRAENDRLRNIEKVASELQATADNYFRGNLNSTIVALNDFIEFRKRFIDTSSSSIA